MLIISERGLRMQLPRLAFYEFEDVVCQVDHVELCVPQAEENPKTRWTNFISKCANRTGFEVSRRAEIPEIQLTREYDLLFVILPRWTDSLVILEKIKGWRDHVRTAICWVHEVWHSWLADPRTHGILPVLERFDRVIVGLKSSRSKLSELLRVPCDYVQAGIDAIRFCPYPNPPQRFIDFYSMGRRSQETHEALLEWASDRDKYYMYDTVQSLAALGIDAYRTHLASLIQRTRYFSANKARVDNPEVTAGQDEIGLRYFEGAAAGTIMMGETPRHSEAFHELFNWPDAVIDVPFGSRDMAEVIDALENDPERVARIRYNNVINSLTRLDWVHSWRRILELCDLLPTDEMVERERRLRHLAESVTCKVAAA